MDARASFRLIPLLLAAGCASPLAPDETPERALARQDHEALVALAVAQRPPAPGVTPAREVAGYAYESLVKFPVAHAVASALYAGPAIASDVVVVSFSPLMGSSFQDAIDDTVYDSYRRGFSFGLVWRAIPSVNPVTLDLYARDPDESVPPPLQLQPALSSR
ncbi:MAG: hypothetical protein HY720_29575 [Planctomycetes bacterium]|nr:hypothetical protein [Planctomycetota bacterium]